jgi:hypothetical protein
MENEHVKWTTPGKKADHFGNRTSALVMARLRATGQNSPSTYRAGDGRSTSESCRGPAPIFQMPQLCALDLLQASDFGDEIRAASASPNHLAQAAYYMVHVS